MQKLLLQELDARNEEAAVQVTKIVCFNQPPLVYTTNEHYLTTLFAATVSEIPPRDSNSALILYYRIKAYIKVQKKLVIETLAKVLELSLYVDAGKSFDRVIAQAVLPEMSKLVVEPDSVAREREILTFRKKVLEEAYALIE